MRRPTRRQPRGQTLALGAVTLLILALVVFITLNVTQSVHQKIKLQNYADAKAFTVAVQEARALNYIAYTNRAIASNYVAMANLHAYMSEAAMLADADFAAQRAMWRISRQERSLCYCCCTPVGCGPCCFNHCIDAFWAAFYSAMFMIDYVSGDKGGDISALDQPFRTTMTALDTHIDAMHLSQLGVQADLALLIGNGGELPKLKQHNVGLAPVVDEGGVTAENAYQLNNVFLNDDDLKKRIMAETANAARPPFTWNRSMNPLALNAMFAPAMRQLRSTAGNEGTFLVTQTNPMGGGRSGFVDSGFSTGWSSDPSPGGEAGSNVSSYAYGLLSVRWRHGFSTQTMPTLSIINPATVTTGDDDGHSGGWIGDLFNDPHSGSDHDMPIDMSRFLEFNIGTEQPFNQPAYFAAVSADTRFNERGKRSVWEITDSGRITFEVGTSTRMRGQVQLSNDRKAYSASKALVYYHRMGDWSDYPNLFSPYWRAKLEPMTQAEAVRVLGLTDGQSAAVVGAMSAQPQGGRAAVNLQ